MGTLQRWLANRRPLRETDKLLRKAVLLIDGGVTCQTSMR
jgi:hypothetical protein